MHVVLLRHCGNHVCGFLCLCHFATPVPRFPREDLPDQTSVLAQQFFGALVLNYRSLYGHLHDLVSPFSAPELSTPFSRNRNFCPFLVPCGILSNARPSVVGTSIFAPKPASSIRTGTRIRMSSPSRLKEASAHLQRKTFCARNCPLVFALISEGSKGPQKRRNTK